MSWLFFVNSAALGFGLAMDAFSVSIANGLNETNMSRRRMCMMAGVYGFFQFLMPMVGWICVHTAAELFRDFQKFIPWIALILLVLIGGKMLKDGIRGEDDEAAFCLLGLRALLMQGVATSIDALSVGFTIAGYTVWQALAASLIIAGVTFVICMIGLRFGKGFGARLSKKATIFGGCILIVIGLEIFIRGIFGI